MYSHAPDATLSNLCMVYYLDKSNTIPCPIREMETYHSYKKGVNIMGYCRKFNLISKE